MKRVGGLLITIFLLAMVGCASAHEKLNRKPNQVQSTDDEALIRLLQNRVSQMDRQMFTFHYQQDDIHPKSIEDVRRRLNGWQEHFFDTSIRGDAVGPGTYVATDPVASRSYGGEHPQLYVIPIRSGARVFDAYSTVKPVEAEILKKTANEMGCGTVNKGGMDEWIEFFRNNEKLECRQLIISAFSKMEVEVIIYPFSAADELTGCRSGNKFAMNLISFKSIDQKNLTFFSDNVEFGGSPIQNNAIFRLYEDASKDYSLQLEKVNYSQSYDIPKTLQNYANMPQPFTRNWKAMKIGRCGKIWSFERRGRFDDLFIEKIGKFRKDEGLRRKIVETAIEFKKMTRRLEDPNKPSLQGFYVENLKNLLYLDFKINGWPLDEVHFAQWMKAQKQIFESGASSEGRCRGLQDLLDEDESKCQIDFDNQKMEEVLSRTLQSNGENPHLIWRLFENYGAGPRATLLAINSALRMLGLVAYSIPPTPMGAANVPVRLQAEAELMKSALQECIDLYRKAQSLDEVMSGKCGFYKDAQN